MSVLLDSHVLDWAFRDDPRLSAPARRAIAAEHAGTLFISDISLIELARHVQSGAIPVEGHAQDWLKAAAAFVTVLPVTPVIAWRATEMDWRHAGGVHKDPADRIIVATALVHDLPLATKDARMHAMAKHAGLRTIW